MIPENKYINISLSLFFMHHILSQFLLLIASFIIIKKYKRLKNTQFSLGWKLKEVLNKAIEDGDITQGGTTWRPFVGSKNGNENFRQLRIYNFRIKCVVFARNRKFAKLTQWNMQYISCNSALLAQETLFLTQKGIFFAQRSPKSA